MNAERVSGTASAAARAGGGRIPWRTLGMAAALAAIWALFTATTDGTFLSTRNLSNLARQMSVTALLSTGMVLVIVCGQIDLSAGALCGLCGACAALLAERGGWPVAAACAAVLALGALLGLAQGLLVACLEIPAFIVTLGGMLVFQGSLLGLTRGVSVTPPREFLLVGQAYLPKPAGWALGAAWLALCLWRAARAGARGTWLALGALGAAGVAVFNDYEGLPVAVILVLVLAAAFWVVGSHTPFGRHLYAIGGNREAAFYSGIPIRARLAGAFTLMGGVSALAGIVLTARVGSASSDAGRMMELDAIAAAVIGGTSLMGGRGSVWGALLGAALMSSLDNGMSLMNTEAFWQPVIKGGILIAAVTVDLLGRRGK